MTNSEIAKDPVYREMINTLIVNRHREYANKLPFKSTRKWTYYHLKKRLTNEEIDAIVEWYKSMLSLKADIEKMRSREPNPDIPNDLLRVREKRFRIAIAEEKLYAIHEPIDGGIHLKKEEPLSSSPYSEGEPSDLPF